MLLKAHRDLFEAEIWAIETQSEVDILSEQNSQTKTRLESRRMEVREIDREYEAARGIARTIHEECLKMCADRTPEEIQLHAERGDITSDDLEVEIESTRGKIAFLQGGNPDVIKQYEARQKEIDRLKEKLAAMDTDLSGLQNAIQELRSKWEPQLEELISQISDAFSHNFEKIGCAGQVGIYKDDDFDQWAVQIHVKFR